MFTLILSITPTANATTPNCVTRKEYAPVNKAFYRDTDTFSKKKVFKLWEVQGKLARYPIDIIGYHKRTIVYPMCGLPLKSSYIFVIYTRKYKDIKYMGYAYNPGDLKEWK